MGKSCGVSLQKRPQHVGSASSPGRGLWCCQSSPVVSEGWGRGMLVDSAPLTMSSPLYLQISTSGRSRPQGCLGRCGGHLWDPTWCSLLRRSPRKWCSSPPEAHVPCGSQELPPELSGQRAPGAGGRGCKPHLYLLDLLGVGEVSTWGSLTL